MSDIKTSQNQLNEKFFKDMDIELIERLRVKMQHDQQAQALSETCGISDETVLEELVASGVCTETISAFRMVPLLVVAWSDGEIQPEERDAIMKAAGENGVTTDSPAFALLNSWLNRKPSDDLLIAWKDYTQHLVQTLSPAAVVSLKHEVIARAEQIATAAGGFLGLGSISANETAAISELKSVFPE